VVILKNKFFFCQSKLYNKNISKEQKKPSKYFPCLKAKFKGKTVSLQYSSEAKEAKNFDVL